MLTTAIMPGMNVHPYTESREHSKEDTCIT